MSQNRQGLNRSMCFLVLAVVFVGGPAWAGGIMLYRFASPDVGYPAAGSAARVQDAATVFTNPPGWAWPCESEETK